jgi:hypothetical protein
MHTARPRIGILPAGCAENGVRDAHCRQNRADIMHAHDVGAAQN